jgi:CheY-like chemotaxis protein
MISQGLYSSTFVLKSFISIILNIHIYIRKGADVRRNDDDVNVAAATANNILSVARQNHYSRLNRKKTNQSAFRQRHSSTSLHNDDDEYKIKQLTRPHYYNNDDPQKRYFPNVIIIDDEPDVLLTFQSYLDSEGFNVQTFSKSDEALEYLTSHPTTIQYSVVITDIRMPYINGIQLYQKLKSINKDIRVMFVSALDAADELLSIFPDIKDKDIIKKPIKKDQFINKVKSAIFYQSFILLCAFVSSYFFFN